MSKFIDANQALAIIESNKKKQIEYYLNNIENDRKVNAVKRGIVKAVVMGETYAYVFFWTGTKSERVAAIEKYFSDLGYSIAFDGHRCVVRLYKRENIPKPPEIHRRKYSLRKNIPVRAC